jgi:hypothetical protein
MQSTRAITIQLTATPETELSSAKNLFEEHKEFLSRLADQLACCKNIYAQYIQLKDDEIIKTDDAERQSLFEQIRTANNEELINWVDSTVEAKGYLISAFQDKLTELNQSLKTTLTQTDMIGVFSSTMHVVKQIAVYINRINTILDSMPQAIFSDKNVRLPGLEHTKADAEKIYELIKINRKAFTAHYVGNVASNNLMSPRRENLAAVAPVDLGFGKCHV